MQRPRTLRTGLPGLLLSGPLLIAQLFAPLAVAQATTLMDAVDASLPALDGQTVDAARLSGAATLPEAAAPTAGGQAETLPSLPRLFALALQNDADLASQRYDAEATAQQVPTIPIIRPTIPITSSAAPATITRRAIRASLATRPGRCS